VQYYDQPDGRGPLPSCPILAGERRLSQANAGPSILAMGRPMGYGAFQMAARYSTINLNDRFTPGVVPSPRSNAVGGGQQTVDAVGLNWYPNSNVRFLFDYLHGKIDKRFSTAAAAVLPERRSAPQSAASSMPWSCARRSRSEPLHSNGCCCVSLRLRSEPSRA
jgi:hypothetical protein